MATILNAMLLITYPTTVVKDSATLIDHICTTYKEMSCESGVIPLGLSDHHMVYMICKHKHQKVHHKHTEIQYRSYKNFFKDVFQQSLRQVPWSILEETNDPGRVWFIWKSYIQQFWITML